MHFKPWGISPFADLPATELRDRCVPVDDVWQRSLDRIRNRVGDLASATETLRVLEEELRSRLAEAPSRGLNLVRHAGGRLATSRGAIPVGALTDAARRPVDRSELAQAAGYFDHAHFSREFKDFTGHTPTDYLDVRRRFPAEPGFPPDRGPMRAD